MDPSSFTLFVSMFKKLDLILKEDNGTFVGNKEKEDKMKEFLNLTKEIQMKEDEKKLVRVWWEGNKVLG